MIFAEFMKSSFSGRTHFSFSVSIYFSVVYFSTGKLLRKHWKNLLDWSLKLNSQSYTVGCTYPRVLCLWIQPTIYWKFWGKKIARILNIYRLFFPIQHHSIIFLSLFLKQYYITCNKYLHGIYIANI